MTIRCAAPATPRVLVQLMTATVLVLGLSIAASAQTPPQEKEPGAGQAEGIRRAAGELSRQYARQSDVTRETLDRITALEKKVDALLGEVQKLRQEVQQRAVVRPAREAAFMEKELQALREEVIRALRETRRDLLSDAPRRVEREGDQPRRAPEAQRDAPRRVEREGDQPRRSPEAQRDAPRRVEREGDQPRRSPEAERDPVRRPMRGDADAPRRVEREGDQPRRAPEAQRDAPRRVEREGDQPRRVEREGDQPRRAPEAQRDAPRRAEREGDRADKPKLEEEVDVPDNVRKYCVALVEKYDTNKDGVLSKDEWTLRSFDAGLADQNKDGKVTPLELARYLVRKR